jgi:hypothetical protein
MDIGEIRSLAVANRGGHTTSRRLTAVHSQMTLATHGLVLASALPAGPNWTPLPPGSPPGATRSARAPGPAAGSTQWNTAQAPEKPAKAAALISWWSARS